MKWNEMTKAERDAYVNQDVKRKSWREPLSSEIGQELYSAMADVSGIGDLMSGDTHLDIRGFEDVVDPVSLEILRLFHCEQKKQSEIAAEIKIQYVRGGNIIFSRPLTVSVVNKKLMAGRKAVREALSRRQVAHILVTTSKATN